MKRKLLRLLNELKSRQNVSETASSLLRNIIPPAKRILELKSRKIAILCSRRAGKTYTMLSIILAHSLFNPGSNILYIALTRQNVKRIAWSLIKQLLNKYNIKAKTNATTLTIELTNGSIIELIGANGTEDLADRLLGIKSDLIVIDEAASFKPAQLDYLINNVLNPTLIDTKGTLYLISSPQAIKSGLFYEACHGLNGWDYVSWNTLENPYMKENFQEEIDELLEINPDIINTSWFKRNFLNQWSIDNSDLAYRLYPANIINQLPNKELLKTIIALDIGWTDSNAIIVGQIFKHDPTLYVVEDWKQNEMTTDKIAEQLHKVINKYKYVTVYGDSANKLTLNDLRLKYNIPIIATKKNNKVERIESINAQFAQYKIKVLDTCEGLLKEMNTLTRVEKNDSWIENPAQDNHECDAFSYVFLGSTHYLEKEKEILSESERMKLAALRRGQNKQRGWI